MTRMVSSDNGRPKRSRSLAENLVATFSEKIRNCSLHPGDKLPTETEIARQPNSRARVDFAAPEGHLAA